MLRDDYINSYNVYYVKLLKAGLGFTIGSRQTDDNTDSTALTHSGDTIIYAGNRYVQI